MGVRYCETWDTTTEYRVKEDGSLKWTGTEAFIRNHYYRDIYDFNAKYKNDSLIRSELHGTKVGDIHTGCLGLMQSNVADFTSVTVDYPVVETNLSNVQVMWPLYFHIGSLESRKTLSQDKMLINPFDTSITVLIVLASLLTCVLYSICYSAILMGEKNSRTKLTTIKGLSVAPRVIKRYKSKSIKPQIAFSLALCKSIYLLKFIIGQHTVNWEIRNLRYNSFKLIIFFFAVGTLFLSIVYISCISTDLTVVVEGDHMDSYSTVIKNNCKVYFLAAAADADTFSKSPPGTLQYEIWTKHNPVSKKSYLELLDKTFIREIAGHRAVYITTDPTYFSSFFCGVRQTFGGDLAHANPFIFKQPGSLIRGFTAGVGFNLPQHATRIKRSFEHDLINPIFYNLWPYYFRQIYVENKRDYTSCMREQMTKKYREFKQVSLKLLRYQFKLCSSFFVISAVILIVEQFLYLFARRVKQKNKV